jgi:hypothetical protein
MFLEAEARKNRSIPVRQVLDSPALIKNEAHGIYMSKITIYID